MKSVPQHAFTDCRYVWAEHNPVLIIVHRPGNLSEPHAARRLIDFVDALEALPQSTHATLAWWRDYDEFLRMREKVHVFDFSEYYVYDDETPAAADAGGIDLSALDTFLALPQYAHWRDSVKWVRR